MPAAGAHIHVGYNRALPGAGLLSMLTRGRTVTRSDGTFTIAGLVPSTPIFLQAGRGERLSDIVTVSVEPGLERPGIVLRLGLKPRAAEHPRTDFGRSARGRCPTLAEPSPERPIPTPPSRRAAPSGTPPGFGVGPATGPASVQAGTARPPAP